MSRYRVAWAAGIAALLLAAAAGAGFWLAPEAMRAEVASIWRLLWSTDPEPVRAWILQFGGWAPVVSALLQVATSLFPPLPGFPLYIANAMVWGPFWGGLLSWATGLLAASICFGLARWLGRPGVERFVNPEKLARLDGFMERRGVLAVFLARLIPFINPDLASYAAGATAMGWGPFLLAMGGGSLPAVAFYSVVGATAVEATGAVLGIVAAASLVPLVILWFLRKRVPGISGGETDPPAAPND